MPGRDCNPDFAEIAEFPRNVPEVRGRVFGVAKPAVTQPRSPPCKRPRHFSGPHPRRDGDVPVAALESTPPPAPAPVAEAAGPSREAPETPATRRRRTGPAREADPRSPKSRPAHGRRRPRTSPPDAGSDLRHPGQRPALHHLPEQRTAQAGLAPPAHRRRAR